MFRVYSETIITGQRLDFTCWTLERWTFEQGVELRLIQPGKPTKNEFIESFNGWFREGRLEEHWFSNIVHTRKTIQSWRQDYNECSPYSSLDCHTSAEFATDRLNKRDNDKQTDITNWRLYLILGAGHPTYGIMSLADANGYFEYPKMSMLNNVV